MLALAKDESRFNDPDVTLSTDRRDCLAGKPCCSPATIAQVSSIYDDDYW
ncbi:hypothetical protein [Cryobacterium sp. Hz9]|nr:hypothetical protein [Cryobacterium sp. Hz9]